MRTLYVAFVIGAHILSLALAIYTTRASGVPVDILLYAFLIDYLLRLGTIQLLHGALVSQGDTAVAAVASYVSRRPEPGQRSHPVREGEHGPPARLGIYLLVLFVCGYNSKEVTILALAVLTGAAVVAVRQGMDLDASPWAVMGPLLFFRFLYDVSASLSRTPT